MSYILYVHHNDYISNEVKMPTVVKMYRALYAVVTPQHQNKTKQQQKTTKKNVVNLALSNIIWV